MNKSENFIDKDNWERGPCDEEPDRKEEKS